MTRDGNRVGRIRGRGRGASVTLPSSSPSSSALPSPVAPIVAPPPAIVSPTIVSPASIGSPPELPIPSPSDSTAPPTSSSVAGSSTACDLPIVHIEDGRLMPSNTCSHTITKILKQRIYPDGYTWKTISNEYKEYYFEEFKKYFKWDETINSQVHKAFLTQTSTRYTDMVSKIKKNRTSSGKPEFVHEDTWRIWEAYWDRPEVKAKSEQQRKNRMSEVAGPGTGCSRHTGGSRSSIEHFHTLRNELQKEPNLFECFTHTHKKKDGTFVDERSKKIADEIQVRRDAIMQEAEGSTDPPVIDMSQMYVDVVGGVKKQRIYGLGTKSSAFISGNSCSSSATSQLQQEAMKEMMNQQLETMRGEMEAKLQAERTEMEAKLQAERTEMEAKLQAERTEMEAKLQAERTEMEAKLQAERIEMEVKLQAERTQMQAQVQTQMQAQIASLMDELRRNGMLSNPSTQAQQSANSNAENLGDD